MKHDQSGLIETLNQLATAYIETSSYAEALPPLKKALRLASGHPSSWLAVTLNNLGVVSRYTDDLPAAIKYTEQALSVLRRLRDNSPDGRALYAKTLANWGALRRLSRDFRGAERALKEAFKIYTALPGIPLQELGAVHTSLGLFYMDLHDYASAKPYLENALELTRRSDFGITSIQYAVQLNVLADWNRATGHLATAVRLHEQAAAIHRQIYGERHFNYATSLFSLAKLYIDMSWHHKAEIAIRQAVAILETCVGSNHITYQDCFGSLGAVLAATGKYGEAESVVIRSVELARKVFGEKSPHYAASLHNLVMLLPKMSTKGLLHASTAILNLDEMRPTITDTMDAFSALLDKGCYELQVAFLEKIAAIERNAGMEHSSSYARTLLNLGQTYRLLGRPKKAETCLTQALEIERQVGQLHRPELPSCLNAVADLCAATGRAEKALELVQKANELDNYLVGQVFTTGSELQRLQYLKTLQISFHVFLSLVVRHLADSAEAVQAAFDLTLQRKGLGMEALAAQRDAILSGKYPGLEPKLHEWRTLRSRIAQKTLAGPGVEGEEYHRQLLNEWNERKEALEIELAQHIPEMSLDRQLKTSDWRTVAGALPFETRLVEFVCFAEFDFSAPAPSANQWKGGCYVAFVLSPAEPAKVTLVNLGVAQPIDRLIAEFRAAIIGAEVPRHLLGEAEPASASPEKTAEYGQKLRGLVFDPLLPALEGATRIFLATDGNLTRLSFEALPLDQAGFLIDHYELGYLNSGRDVLRWGQTWEGKSAKPLVVADPDFDFSSGDLIVSVDPTQKDHLSRDLLRSDLYFARLHGTQYEGEEVARLLQVSPLLGQAALEQSLKSVFSPFVLHIATHGFFLPDQGFEPEQPIPDSATLPVGESVHPRTSFLNHKIENPLLRSGLALAGANRTLKGEGGLPPEAEDGILTAEDVTAMDLSGTELVVLSACETGLGAVMVGEGVYGLQRAIVLAGAKTLVMSLWKVPDYQTCELMVEFYQRLLEGVPRAEALRQAQLVLKERYADPFYWAAFICQGDPGPLPEFKEPNQTL